MSRLIEFFEMELEIFDAVMSRRIRSFILLIAAFVVPPLLVMAALRIAATPSLPILEQSLRTVLPLLGLALMLKLLFLAIQTYLKDRAMLLR